ncbi:hypothetical protein [Sphaerisporangium album]|uniref:hypothetical protein n=1 Tax=Sphaerisporangium album TaxID=509200 RepID=UPI0015F06F0A|nr:hypothetical protein [Sphaerisporangium album]
MLRRRRLALLAVAVTGGSAILAVGPAPAQSPASAAEPTPTVEVWSADGSTRLDGITNQLLGPQQTVTVKWSGFTPNSSIVLTQCTTPGRAWYVYDGSVMNATNWSPFDWCGPQIRKPVSTGPDGSGSATFTVKQGTMAPSVVYSTGANTKTNKSFLCAANAPCIVIASECEWSQPLDYQTTWPQTLYPRAAQPEGVVDPARAAASQSLNFAPGDDGNPITTVIPPLTLPEFPKDKPPPVLPPVTGGKVGGPIYGTGSANVATVFEGWLIDVRAQAKAADAGYSRTTSDQGGDVLKSGFDTNFDSGADYAVTGIDYTKDKVGGDVAYAPISLTALAIANQVEVAGQPIREARMSPLTLAWMLGRNAAPTTGPLNDLNAYSMDWGVLSGGGKTMLAKDNHGCELPPRSVTPIFRLGKSAQNKVLSAWLGANIPLELFKKEFPISDPGSLEFLSSQAGVRGTQSGAETASQLATQFGDLTKSKADGSPDENVFGYRNGRASLGYLDITEVKAYAERGFTLGVSPLLNAAGKYVAPTKESILAAFATMKKEADGTYTPVFDAKDAAAAYPLPMIHYLAVPKRNADGKNPLPQDRRIALAALIRYIVGDEAQAKVERLGGAPLPQALRAQSLQVADMLETPDTPSDDPTQPPAGNGGGGNGGGGNGGGGNGGTGPKTTNEGTPGPPDDNADLLDGAARPAPTATVRITHTPSPRATAKSSGTGKSSGGSGSGGSSNQQPIGGGTNSGTNTGGTGAGGATTTPPPAVDPGTGTGQTPPAETTQQPGAQTTPSAQPLANEGTIRGGTIPAASWAARTSLLLILGLIALSVGGTWRGYVLWRIRANAVTATAAGPKPPTGAPGSGATPPATSNSGTTPPATPGSGA